MVSLSVSQEQEIQLQNPIFDALYCEEERFDEVSGDGFGFGEESEECDENHKKHLTLFENDLFWEDDELVTLLSKEKETHLDIDNLESDESLIAFRKEAIEWILRVIAHYNFMTATAVLAVGYYDRLISSICFQGDKPWMSQLAAVACLSIAAKMEEIQVPLLLDFQVEDSKFVFEAETIQRMELLLLSTLRWRMKLVTPLSFFDHIVRRFGLMTNLNGEFLNRCEHILLTTIADSRLVHYLPSVIATATILFAVKDFGSLEAMQYQNQIMDALKVSKEKVNDCYGVIQELMNSQGHRHRHILKRKHQSIPGSPSGVIDVCFSCESSNDSWDVALSVTSSSRPPFKKSRASRQANEIS